jgi:hypothetical protein
LTEPDTVRDRLDLQLDHQGPWRRPAEETLDLFPGLVVHDGRQSGSITFGRTRLPIWAVPLSFDGMEDYAVDAEEAAVFEYNGQRFLNNLLELRGEFGRLLLVLANAERLEEERRDAELDKHVGPEGGIVNITPGDPDAVILPPSWWEDPEMVQPVIDQLNLCLKVLEND